MSLNIIILNLNGRRKTVKVSPNAVISQTLEEFCKKEKLDVNQYSFLFQRKILDERLSWRYANVPNNAKLEVIKQEKTIQETPVKIALQYEGNRLQHSFLPGSSLMDILIHWKNDITKTVTHLNQEKSMKGEDNLSTTTLEVNYEPSILYIRQEITGNEKLTTTTLKSLGLTTGSAILRLSYKKEAASPPVKEKPKSSEDSLKMGLVKANKDLCDVAEVEEGVIVESHNDCNSPQGSKSSENVAMQKDGGPVFVADGNVGTTDNISQEIGVNEVEHLLVPLAQDKQQDAVHSQTEDPMDKLFLHPVSSNEEMDVSESVSSQDFIDATSSLSSESIEVRNERVRQRSISATDLPVKKFKATPPSTLEQENFLNFKFPETTNDENLNQHEDEKEVIELFTAPCDREYVFFEEKEENDAVRMNDDISDEFFELTIDDIKKRLSELRYQQKEFEEKQLTTARSRQLQRERALNQYPKIVVKVIFPNRAVLQGIFRPAERLQVLYNFVRSFLSDCLADFYLYTTPPRFILKDMNSLLYDCHLSPASKVYFTLRNREFLPTVISEHVVKSSSAEGDAKLREIFNLKIKTQENSDTGKHMDNYISGICCEFQVVGYKNASLKSKHYLRNFWQHTCHYLWETTVLYRYLNIFLNNLHRSNPSCIY